MALCKWVRPLAPGKQTLLQRHGRTCEAFCWACDSVQQHGVRNCAAGPKCAHAAVAERRTAQREVLRGNQVRRLINDRVEPPQLRVGACLPLQQLCGEEGKAREAGGGL